MNWKDPDSKVPVRKKYSWLPTPLPPPGLDLHSSQEYHLFHCKHIEEANLLSKKAVVSQNSWAQEGKKNDSAYGRLEAYEKQHNLKT